jgi:hypothetical protein
MGKKTVLENLDLVLITIDETVDDGCELARIACTLCQPMRLLDGILNACYPEWQA